MNVAIRKTFEKDALKLPHMAQHKLTGIIAELHAAKKLSEINNCKKLSGYKNAFRIRLGDYRIGFFYENDTIELVRILARRELYRFFP